MLRAIRDLKLTVSEVYAADCENRLHELTGERETLARPLWQAVEEWLGRPLWGEAAEKYEGPELGPTQRRYAVCFKALRQRAGLGDKATVQFLGDINWQSLKATWPKSDGDWAQYERQ